jgi:hypothetical protein
MGLPTSIDTHRSASNITRCPRMDSIRYTTRSIGMVIGMFTPWNWFPSGEEMYRAAGAGYANAPGRGRSCRTRAGGLAAGS